MKKAMAIAATVLGLMLTAGSVVAQSKAGTSIAQFLKIEPGARIAAMGNAGVAIYDGIQAVYYNPAALGAIQNGAVELTHSDWYAGIDFDYGAAAVPVRGLGTLFASVTSLSSGDIEVRTVDQPDGTGEQYTVSDLAFSLGFGRQITSRFGAGVQVTYLNETIWHTSMHAVTLSAGTAYLLTEDGVRIGASISNLGTSSRFSGGDLLIQYDQTPGEYGDNGALPGEQYTDDFPVPILFRAGISVPYRISEDSRILFQADGFHPSDNTESVSGGAEWTLKDAFALRAGYQHLFQEDSDLGLTLGAGLQGNFKDHRFQFDYAWADHARLNETHRMTFVINF